MSAILIIIFSLIPAANAKTYSTYKIKRANIKCTPSARSKQPGDVKFSSVTFFFNDSSTPKVRVNAKYKIKSGSNIKYKIKGCQVTDKGTKKAYPNGLVTFKITNCEMDSGRWFTDDPDLSMWFWYEGKTGAWRNGSGEIAYIGLGNNTSMRCAPLSQPSTREFKHQIKEDDRTEERTTNN